MKYIRIVIALAFLSTLFTATTCDDSTVYRADVALVNNSKELFGGTIVPFLRRFDYLANKNICWVFCSLVSLL